MPRLMIASSIGPIAHELSEELVTLGRSPENMIQLDDPSVSGKHAQLQLVGDDVQLTDLGSTNGTTVNDAAITAALLRAGDRVRFGKVEACFECEVAGDAQPLPAMEEVEANTAAVSARPADFSNASPFPRRTTEKDPGRTALFAAAVVAILAFIGSMLALAQMHAPMP
ncbi:MAG: FHA domain-containing protein [Chthoniobacterales bacterium]|nr:FHA domain-containing protein [Chthoniobacterales bacterium]